MNLSIIIPIYNAEPYLFRCLNSIYNQNSNGLTFEIIAINDGSSDDPSKILQQFSCENLFTINQVNRGAGTARNAGLKLAKGDYIWFVDADDYLDANAFQDIEPYIFSGKFDLLSFDYAILDRYGNKSKCINNYSDEISFEEYILHEHGLFLWKHVYRKQIIDNHYIRFIDGIKNIEDFHFNVLFFCCANHIKCIKSILYNYSFNPISTSRSLSRINLLKLASDSQKVHLELHELSSHIYDQKKKEVVEMLLNKSIVGFFYSLFKFKYKFKELYFYYENYKNNRLLPTHIKRVNIRFKIFENFQNNRFLFLFTSFIKKIYL